MTSFFYFNSRDLSISLEKEKTFRVEYKGKPIFFVVSSNQIKKRNSFLEISLDAESKNYMECLQANLRWLLRENKQADNQLHLFFLDTSETPKTAGIMNQEFPKESFTGKVMLHLPQILPNKAFLEIFKIYLEKMIEPSSLLEVLETRDNELETFLPYIQ